jgi:4-hydroxy-L-threonine phosphate dehydrogenase PdxA
MKNKPIIIVNGEPNSIFLEIFFKAIKYNKFKSPLILISSLKILKLQMKKLNFKININTIDHKNFKKNIIDKNSINLINVNITKKIVLKKYQANQTLLLKIHLI